MRIEALEKTIREHVEFFNLETAASEAEVADTGKRIEKRTIEVADELAKSQKSLQLQDHYPANERPCPYLKIKGTNSRRLLRQVSHSCAVPWGS